MFPVPPFVDVTAPVVFVDGPGTLPVTFTAKVHEPATAIVAPESARLLAPALAVIVPPPQLPVRPTGVANNVPVGSGSVKATPESPVVFADGLVIVKVSVETPLGAITVGLNILPMTGGATMTMPADAVPPVPPSVEITEPVVLVTDPATVPVTFTVKLQEEIAPSVALPRVMLPDPGAAVIVPPPQVPTSPLAGVETINPAGRVSVKPIPDSEDAAFGFEMVNPSVVLPLSGMVPAPNAFAIVGGMTTVMEAFEVRVPLHLHSNWTVALLFFVPAEVPVTLTETVQEALVANVPAERLTDPAPAAPVAVPPQVSVRLGVAATSNPAGNVSLNASPVNGTAAFGFEMVKLSVLTPFRGMEFGANDLIMVAAVATLKFALAVLPVPPFVDVTALVTLVYWPDVTPRTFTTIAHEVFGVGMLPPVRLMLVPPASAEAVPLHVVVNPFGVFTTSPSGSVSINPTPVIATLFCRWIRNRDRKRGGSIERDGCGTKCFRDWRWGNHGHVVRSGRAGSNFSSR